MLAILLLAAHAQTRVDPDFQRVESSRQDLSKGKLTPTDRSILERTANSARPDLGLAAIAKLEWAVQLNRYPKQKLLKTIERRTELAPYWWGVNYAAEYGRTLGLKLTGDPTLDAAGQALTMRHESPMLFSHDDRAFILRCLHSKTVAGRFDAVYGVIPKKHLLKPNVLWIRIQLTRETAKHAGPEREFWRFVGRVAKYRGAA